MRVIPPKLAHWIEQHKGIVQPYALDALVDLWFDLTTTTTVVIPHDGPRTMTTVSVGSSGSSGSTSEAPK